MIYRKPYKCIYCGKEIDYTDKDGIRPLAHVASMWHEEECVVKKREEIINNIVENINESTNAQRR